MSITLNIDDATAEQLERAARASGVSLSQLVTRLVEQNGAAPAAAASGKASTLPPLPPPHNFGNPPEFDYRKAMAMLQEEEATAYREKFNQGQ